MRQLQTCPQPDIRNALWQIVSAIPTGSVSSYGRIAAALGDANTARWVASDLLKHSERSPCCPCFRVVRQAGIVGSFAHGLSADKAELIAAEGSEMTHPDAATIQIANPNWASLPTLRSQPFQLMRAWQVDVSQTQLRVQKSLPNRIAGLDVSYLPDGRAAAACVVTEIRPEKRRPARVLWSNVAVVYTNVPYVTGYLAFRELPALLAVYEQAVAEGEWPGLAMIDGSGRLHPHRAGLASCFSIATGEPSIGITKSRLMGVYNADSLGPKSAQPIRVEGEQVGTAHQSPTGGKPVFASPGCGIRQADIDNIVAATMTVHRVPEPIYWADRISRQHVRDAQEN